MKRDGVNQPNIHRHGTVRPQSVDWSSVTWRFPTWFWWLMVGGFLVEFFAGLEGIATYPNNASAVWFATLGRAIFFACITMIIGRWIIFEPLVAIHQFFRKRPITYRLSPYNFSRADAKAVHPFQGWRYPLWGIGSIFGLVFGLVLTFYLLQYVIELVQFLASPD